MNDQITKNLKLIFILFFILGSSSCRAKEPYVWIEDGHAFTSERFSEDLKQFKDTFPIADISEGVVPFQLQTPAFQHCMTVHLSDGEKSFLFKVDTGADYSAFFSEPSSSMLVGTYENTDVAVLLLEIFSRKVPLMMQRVENPVTVTGFDNPADIGLDGIIGMPFLQLFDTVVFDFQNNQIVLNSPPISNLEIPFTYDDLWYNKYFKPFISITVDGKRELGIIDTGAPEVILRETFGDGNNEISRNEIVDYLNDSTSISFARKRSKVLRCVEIGDVTVSGVAAHYWNDERFIGNDRATKVFKYINSFGNSLWKDHVIQLDFENQVFRIK